MDVTARSKPAIAELEAVNDAPIVSGPVDLGAIDEDGSIRITEEELEKQLDVEGDALSITNLKLNKGNGNLKANTDGSWTFTPTKDWNGTVEFSYGVSDGERSSSTQTIDKNLLKTADKTKFATIPRQEIAWSQKNTFQHDEFTDIAGILKSSRRGDQSAWIYTTSKSVYAARITEEQLSSKFLETNNLEFTNFGLGVKERQAIAIIDENEKLSIHRLTEATDNGITIESFTPNQVNLTQKQKSIGTRADGINEEIISGQGSEWAAVKLNFDYENSLSELGLKADARFSSRGERSTYIYGENISLLGNEFKAENVHAAIFKNYSGGKNTGILNEGEYALIGGNEGQLYVIENTGSYHKSEDLIRGVNLRIAEIVRPISHQTALLNVSPINDDPRLTGERSDLIDGDKNWNYTIQESDLLKGYTDIDGDTLTVKDLKASKGILKILAMDLGSSPPHNFQGDVTLSYAVSDSNGAELVPTNLHR